MKILHILRSEPEELVRLLMAEMSIRGNQGEEVRLYEGSEGSVDYDWLVRRVFESEMVICWW